MGLSARTGAYIMDLSESEEAMHGRNFGLPFDWRIELQRHHLELRSMGSARRPPGSTFAKKNFIHKENPTSLINLTAGSVCGR